MKPNDQNGKRPTAERPFRVLVIAGSGRRQYNCPGVDSKARTLMLRMADRLPAEWEIDLENLGNVYERARIQSMNGGNPTFPLGLHSARAAVLQALREDLRYWVEPQEPM